jgi:hypothetical protein
MKRTYLLVTALLVAPLGPVSGQNGGWSEPIPVDSINGVIDDYYPSISPDGLTMYFTSGNRIRMTRWNGSSWGASADLGDNVNSGQRQVKATVTPDNRTLYFTTYKTGGYGSYDIWKSQWDDSCNCWGVAEVLPPPINTEFMEWDVQLSHDGRKMYLSSDRYFSWGDLDIWCSEWNDTMQSWGEPVNLGLTVNGSRDDYGAYPTVDGTRLYFCSWTPHGFEPPRWLGPVDLFVAFYQGNGWDSLDIMPPPITTGYWEESPAITDNGLTLYLASTRPGGPGWTDIYVTHYVTGIEEGGEDREKYELDLKVFPNPGNDAFVFKVNGNSSSRDLTLTIYNISGSFVCRLFADDGSSFFWDGRSGRGQRVSSGVYFVVFKAKGISLSKRVILLR